MDMAQGYMNAVRAHAGQADIVFDRFHIERYLTEAVNEVRRAGFSRIGGTHREAIPRQEIPAAQETPAPSLAPEARARRAFRLNRRLNLSYMLKEQFDDVWHYRTEVGMALSLERWRRLIRWQRIRPLDHL